MWEVILAGGQRHSSISVPDMGLVTVVGWLGPSSIRALDMGIEEATKTGVPTHKFIAQ